MKRIGFFTGAVVLAFVMATANTTIFAESCCGVKKETKECNQQEAHKCNEECAEKGCIKQTSATDNPCAVCGQPADSKGQQVETRHAGETMHLCCQGCLNAYNKNPDKYSKVKRKRETHKAEPPKRKQRGEGYY
ncbi:copper-exporting ATPase [Candidatus Scalindua japonica]|uniref:Copper-exporting ATPase n=1 Tax=Candidatus Scalindua japonica TaxID=1284222 RepID=A0A286U1W1_9BACT|nr:hypothetical protein [Candidatus Scalindua japonica]GAX62116.1 copper-exporting ATPase [Candidatus Scalindua japonica]